MTTIAEVRQKYPQYSDLSDEQLAKGLHAKFYSDMPYADFAAKIGLGSQPKAEPTAGERTNAAVGGVNRGIAGLAGLPVDTVENLINLGLAVVGSAANASGRPDLAPDLLKGSVGGSESIARGLEAIGINTRNPRPDDTASRMLYTGGTVVGGSLVPGARPAPTVAAAAGGAVASEALGPEYTGVGAMTPAAASQAAAAARTAVANRVQPNVETFKQAGTTPTVGQATEVNFLQGLENLLSKFPGGQGLFRRFAENQQERLGAQAKTGVSAEDAGRAIEAGTKGFISRTKAVWQRLDDELAQKVGRLSGYNVPPTNTLQALDDLVKPVAGAEQTTGALVNNKIAEIRANFTADVKNNMGGMPFEALRALRSRVGAMLDDALVTGIPGGELKKLYGALSKDMEAGANAVGAGKEFARQNDFYRARMDRLENTLERVLGKTPEETFKRFMPTDPNQVNTVRQVMRSLDPEQRQVVTEAVVERLGRASPGRQDAAGEVFSSETFLTNWNKLSPGAKVQLFSDPAMRKNLDAIASVSENIREGSRVFANPSGTAGAGAPYGLAGMVATGHYAAAGGLVVGANVTSRMLTSPNVVEWLAKAPTVTPENQAAYLARLGVIFNETKDQGLKQDLSAYVQSMKDK